MLIRISNFYSEISTLSIVLVRCNFTVLFAAMGIKIVTITESATLPATCITVHKCYYRYLISLAISGAIESPKYPCENSRVLWNNTSSIISIRVHTTAIKKMPTYIRFKMRYCTRDTIIIRESKKIFSIAFIYIYIYNDILIFVILINDINEKKRCQLLLTYVPVR